jgi:hypothetical protein
MLLSVSLCVNSFGMSSMSIKSLSLFFSFFTASHAVFSLSFNFQFWFSSCLGHFLGVEQVDDPD